MQRKTSKTTRLSKLVSTYKMKEQERETMSNILSNIAESSASSIKVPAPTKFHLGLSKPNKNSSQQIFPTNSSLVGRYVSCRTRNIAFKAPSVKQSDFQAVLLLLTASSYIYSIDNCDIMSHADNMSHNSNLPKNNALFGYLVCHYVALFCVFAAYHRTSKQNMRKNNIIYKYAPQGGHLAK